MRSRAHTLSSLVIATSLTTLTLAGCGLFEKQPPRYNTVQGSRHSPALNPTGEGVKEFPPREARWMYESEQDNIYAERVYPGTEEAKTENDYPVEAPVNTGPAVGPIDGGPVPASGQEASPLYYLEQQGMAPTGGMAPAQMSTQSAAPTTPVASAPMAPAQYEQQQAVVPAETLPADNSTFPHLGDVPQANQQMKNDAQNARNEANQAFAEQPAMMNATQEKRQEVNQAAAENSIVQPAPEQPSEVVADFSADAVASPQQRRMLTSEEVDQTVQPNGVYEQNASPLAAPNTPEAELHSQLVQEMPPADAPAMTAPPAPPAQGAMPPPPPPYDVPPQQMQPPADMMPPPPPAPPAPMAAAPMRPLDDVYGAPTHQPIYDPQTQQQPVEVQEYPTVAAQQPLVLTPPGGSSQLNPPSSNLQRRSQYLQESRYARLRSAHRAAPRTY